MKIKYLLIFGVLMFAALGFKCNKPGGGGNPDDGVFRGRVYDDVRAVTPKGAKVLSKNAVNPALLPRVDEGLDKLFDIASRLNGYTVGLDHNLYNVYLFPRSTRCEAAAFLLSADGSPYDGSEYDKDPRPGIVTLCAAGMMADGASYSMLVVNDVDIMATIVRFEGEHLVLLLNDPKRFEATIYHLGSGHPIMPDDTGSRLIEKSLEAATLIIPADLGIGESVLKKGTKVCVFLTK